MPTTVALEKQVETAMISSHNTATPSPKQEEEETFVDKIDPISSSLFFNFMSILNPFYCQSYSQLQNHAVTATAVSSTQQRKEPIKFSIDSLIGQSNIN